MERSGGTHRHNGLSLPLQNVINRKSLSTYGVAPCPYVPYPLERISRARSSGRTAFVALPPDPNAAADVTKKMEHRSTTVAETTASAVRNRPGCESNGNFR